MQIINGHPPKEVWEAVNAKWKVPEKVFFTYGDVIYNVGNAHITPGVIRHEETHRDQQGNIQGGPAEWWRRYLVDDEFRMDQEAEAYATQYKFLCQQNRDKNWQFKALTELARMMASPMYGAMVTRSQAMTMIKQLSTLDKSRREE